MKLTPEWKCRAVLEGELPTSWGMLSEFEATWHAEDATMKMQAARVTFDIRLLALDEVHATEMLLKVVAEAKAARHIPPTFDVAELMVRSTA